MINLDLNTLYSNSQYQAQNTKLLKQAQSITNYTSSVPGSKNIYKNSKLYASCQDFEAVFIKQMLSSMRKTVEKSGLLDGGYGQEIYEDMLYDNYSEKMAKNANFGLADMMYTQLSALEK